MRKFAYRLLLLFSLLNALFIPFSFRLIPFQSQLTAFLFQDLIALLTRNFPSVRVVNSAVSSDSTTMYLLVVLLFLIALFLAFFLPQLSFWKKNHHQILQTVQLILVYYLSVVLLKYGLDKIFEIQFYLPEPNTLYTPLGMLDKDILYWSTMGSSYQYNLFLGISEVIPALLLLYKKTRITGLLILSGVLLNVVFVNFGFDISVKLFSCFLLLTALILLAPASKALFEFLILNKSAALPILTGQSLFQSKILRLTLKALLLLFIFAEALFPHFQNQSLKTDLLPQNNWHGAYEILKITNSKNTAIKADLKIKRLFIHKQNYLIFQYENDSMEDFYFEIAPGKNQLVLQDYDKKAIEVYYNYSENTQILRLNFVENDLIIYAKALPWKKLPLLQPLFHWSVDEIE